MDGVVKPILGIYEKAISSKISLEERFTIAKSSGFDFVELSIDATPNRLSRLYDNGFVSELSSAIALSGIPVYTMALTANRFYPLGSEDTSIRNKGLDIVQRALSLAAEVGIQTVHIAGYDELGNKCCDRTKALFRASIESIDRMTENIPVSPAIETMDADYMGSCSNIIQLFKELGTKQFGCYADIGNLTSRNLDPPNELKLAGSSIYGVHLKDATIGVCRDIPFGDGIVNFDAAFKTLSNMSFFGPMVAETWSYDERDFYPNLANINSFLRKKMDRYY